VLLLSVTIMSKPGISQQSISKDCKRYNSN
jgi:hypothetical protein